MSKPNAHLGMLIEMTNTIKTNDEAAEIAEQIRDKKQEVRYGTREYVTEYGGADE